MSVDFTVSATVHSATVAELTRVMARPEATHTHKVRFVVFVVSILGVALFLLQLITVDRNAKSWTLTGLQQPDLGGVV